MSDQQQSAAKWVEETVLRKDDSQNVKAKSVETLFALVMNMRDIVLACSIESRELELSLKGEEVNEPFDEIKAILSVENIGAQDTMYRKLASVRAALLELQCQLEGNRILVK